ncbi:MAG: magnesium/cobalt transporter CorA [Anaerolineales bacterium]|nr:magnesium/cobalt transporter CorA [Anaerolineales bacterium]
MFPLRKHALEVQSLPERLPHHNGAAELPPPVISIMGYGPNGFDEQVLSDPTGIHVYLKKWPVTWINVDGSHDHQIVQKIGAIFDLHPLVIEDIGNALQRPKVEQYDNYLFIIARMMMPDSPPDTEQLSIFLGKNYVLTFQENPGGDCLEVARERIRRNLGPIRSGGTSYLAYALLDAVIDVYFPVLDVYGDKIEELETQVLERPSENHITQIHQTKREILALRRSIWPMQGTLHTLLLDSPAFTEESRIYLRDAYDHLMRVIELIEIYRELGSDLMDVYLSTVSNRTNEVMRVLTVISTIFIPLTFIAGVYGMNFNHSKSPLNMPELDWYWGYPFVMLLMFGIAGSLLWYFVRRGWLGTPE